MFFFQYLACDVFVFFTWQHVEYPICLETFCICGHHVSHLEAKPLVTFDALGTGSI